jgi:hypothetical protein
MALCRPWPALSALWKCQIRQASHGASEQRIRSLFAGARTRSTALTFGAAQLKPKKTVLRRCRPSRQGAGMQIETENPYVVCK